jgi:hypothetical protein
VLSIGIRREISAPKLELSDSHEFRAENGQVRQCRTSPSIAFVARVESERARKREREQKIERRNTTAKSFTHLKAHTLKKYCHPFSIKKKLKKGS